LGILLEYFGFIDESVMAVTILTPIGNVAVAREKLAQSLKNARTPASAMFDTLSIP